MKKFVGILTAGVTWFLFAGLIWVNLPPAPVPAPVPLPFVVSAPAAPSLEPEKFPSFLSELDRKMKVERLLHTSA